MTSFSGEELAAVQQCRRGTPKAFEFFVSRYMKDAYFIALGMVGNHEDALELSQEAFARAYKNIDKLNPERKFFPWFYQILKNLCISHLRRMKYRSACSLDAEKLPTPAADNDCFSPDAIASDNEIKEKLWQAIGKLDEKHREVIILRHFRNMSYDQMAQALFCNKGTVTSRLYYARRQLRDLLVQEKGGFPDGL